jgi:hypothetical protein
LTFAAIDAGSAILFRFEGGCGQHARSCDPAARASHPPRPHVGAECQPSALPRLCRGPWLRSLHAPFGSFADASPEVGNRPLSPADFGWAAQRLCRVAPSNKLCLRVLGSRQVAMHFR